MPLFSICVSVYNLEKYIGKCLESILTQDFDDFELIVADNGSADRSVEICEAWQKAYPNKMRFIKLPPPTVFGRAALAAFQSASGEYIHSVDGDDYVGEGYLKNIAKIIKEKKPDLIMGSFIGISEDGEVAFKDVDICEEKINNTSHFEAIRYLFSLPFLNKTCWRFIVKKSLFLGEEVKLEDFIKASVFGDGLAVINWLFTAKSIVYYSGPFYYYRRRNGSFTSFRNNTTNYEFLRIVLLYQAYANKISKLNKQNAELLLAHIIWHFKLIVGDYDLITFDGLLQMDQLITKESEVFHSLANYNIAMFNELLDLMRKYGSMEGLVMFFEKERICFASRLKEMRDQDIYVFPTGRFGEGTSRLLEDKGFRVKGFLDNDKTKSSFKFQGLPCYLPEHMLSLSEQEKDKTVVVIATIYDKLFPVLKKQLMDYGIEEEKIIIRD